MGRLLGFVGILLGLFVTNYYFPDEGFLFKVIPTAVLGGVGGGLGALIEEVYKRIKKKKENKIISIDTAEESINLAMNEVSSTIELQTTTTDNSPVVFHYGFGGWLYVFTIGQIVSSIILLNGFDDYFALISSDDLATIRQNGYGDIADRFVGMGLMGIIFMVLMISTTLISWYLAIRMKKLYKSVSIFYIAINGIGSLIIVGAMIYLNYYTDEEIYTNSDISTPIYQAIIYSALWIPYFIKSKRVANTFTK